MKRGEKGISSIDWNFPEFLPQEFADWESWEGGRKDILKTVASLGVDLVSLA